MVTVEARHVVGPQALHGQHVLAGHVAAAAHLDPVVLDLVGVPSEADTEHESPVREVVEAGDRLRGHDRVSLRHQADARSHAEPLGRARRQCQRDERVERPLVVVGQDRVAGRRGCALADRDVGVLRDVQRHEPTLLRRTRQLVGTHRLVRGEHRHAKMHGDTVTDTPSRTAPSNAS
jgi:hypothetical protein